MCVIEIREILNGCDVNRIVKFQRLDVQALVLMHYWKIRSKCASNMKNKQNP